MDNNALIQLVDISTDDIFKDPNEFLDDTLRQLLLETDIDPLPIPREVIFMHKGQRLNTRDAHIVIQKLLKDGHIGVLPDKEWYYITFDGAKLIKDGGYAKASEKAKYQKKIQNLKDYLVIVGAWMAGIGTLLLFGVDFLKHKGWIFSINLMTAGYLILTGILLGLCIPLLILELIKLKRKDRT